jgi:hypothetical protein
MLLASVRRALDDTKNASIAMSSAVVGRPAPPYIATPDVQKYSHLQNVQVEIPLNMGVQPVPVSPVRRAYFVDAFADTRWLLSLHITCVTIRVELKFGAFASYRKPVMRAIAMREGQTAFRRFQLDGDVNAENVIFDFTHKDDTQPFEFPYIAFVKHTTRSTKVHGRLIALKRARYVLYGYDADFIPDEGQEAITEEDEKVMTYVERIIRLSRKDC